MSRIDIFLLDGSNNIKEELNIKKPNTYNELITKLSKNYNNITEKYELLIFSESNEEIIINNDETFNKIDDLIFIRHIDAISSNLSIIDKYCNLFSKSKFDLSEEKYMCILCSIIINNENPFLCYKCQKILHEKCLKEWNEKCKSQNKILFCPNCLNILAIENWNKKLEHIDNLKENEDLINKLYECKLRSNMNKNLNIIKDKKLKEIKNNKRKQSKLLQKYEKYIEKSIHIFKSILNKLNSFKSSLNIDKDNKLDEFLDNYPINFDNLYDNISKVINEELEYITTYIINNNKFDKLMEVNSINLELINNYNSSSFSMSKENFATNVQININQIKKKLNNSNIEEYKDRINLKYIAKSKENHEIFGEEFVLNNKGNIELIINGKSHNLVSNYKLKEGENNVTMIIKNKLTNLSHMFSGCDSLKDIEDLKYLDIRKVKDFSSMFWGCLSLSDIKSLENWNVSNAKNFSYMFGGCSFLSDISPLTNWDVSNCNNFANMFWGCSSLSDVKPLKSWNVTKGKNFSSMFSECLLLSDITPLKNWRIANNSDKSNMFWECLSLNYKEPLTNMNKLKISTFLDY